MEFILVGVGILACAVLAFSARRLLISAVWLALTSALVALATTPLSAMAGPATLWHGGPIVTMDGERPQTVLLGVLVRLFDALVGPA